MARSPQQIWHGNSIELCERFHEGRVNCIITDPPFGVDNKSNMATTVHGAAAARKIANDETPEKALAVFKDVMKVLLPKTSENCDMYCFTSSEVLGLWLQMFDDPKGIPALNGFRRKAILVWEKDGPGMGDLESWGQGHEFIIFLKKGNRASTARRRSGVLHIPQLRPTELIHPHEKPPALLKELILHSTSKGDFIVDPFGGSGSLARAARELERPAVSIELDGPNYEKAVEKFEASTGGVF